MAEFQEHFDRDGNFRQANNMSMEMNNKQMMSEEEYKAMRREKMRLNHLKRLQTQSQHKLQENNQDEYPPTQEQKRAESPFLSQHTFAQELMQDGNLDRRALSRDGPAGPSQPFTTARHSYSQAPQGELPLGGLKLPPYEFTQTPIVSQTRQQAQPNQPARDPRQNIPKPVLMPLNPINIESILQTLPQDIANDADIKAQVRSLAEKQMKLMEKYKEDMERLQREQEDRAAKQDQHSGKGSAKEVPQQPSKRPWANENGDMTTQEGQKAAHQKRPWDNPKSETHHEANPIKKHPTQHHPTEEESPAHKKVEFKKQMTRPYAVQDNHGGQVVIGEPVPKSKLNHKRVSELGQRPITQKSTTASESGAGPYEIYDDERKHLYKKDQLDTSTDVFNRPILPKPKGGYKPPPIPIRNMIGTKNFTDLLAPQHDALFIVQEMASLPKPQNSHRKLNALSEQDKATMDEMFEVMHRNREFEGIVIRDLWWKNFDSMTETARVATVSILIERYFNHLKMHNHDAFQVPVLSHAEIYTKLRSLATQIVDTAAVHNLVNCTSEAMMFQGIEDAMGEIGLPDMVHFIRQELAMQASLRFQVLSEEQKGIPIKPTGALPRSLQVMATPIREKHEIDYHQALHDERKYPEVPNVNQEEFEKRLGQETQSSEFEGMDQHERMEEYERERIVQQFNKSLQRNMDAVQASDHNIGEPDEEFVDAYQEAINYQVQREKQFLERDLSQITPPESHREMQTSVVSKPPRIPSSKHHHHKTENLHKKEPRHHVEHHHGHMLSVEDLHPGESRAIPSNMHSSRHQHSSRHHHHQLSARSRPAYDAVAPLNIFGDPAPQSHRNLHQLGPTAEAINDIIDNYIGQGPQPDNVIEEVERIKAQVAQRISLYVNEEALRASQEQQVSTGAGFFGNSIGKRLSAMVTDKQIQEIKQRMSRIIAQELKPLEQIVPTVQGPVETSEGSTTSERNPIEMEGTSSRASSQPLYSKRKRASDLHEDITNKVMDQLTNFLEGNPSESHQPSNFLMSSLQVPKESRGGDGRRPSFLTRILLPDKDVIHEKPLSSRRSRSNHSSDPAHLPQKQGHQFSLFAINPSRSRGDESKAIGHALSSKLELPPIPRATFKQPEETESERRLSKAIQKHVNKLEAENQMTLKTPYQVFEEQYFNTLKDEVQGKYFVTNEQKYRDYNFNGDRLSDLERKFRIKDEILRREGVTKERVPDARKLLDKIKSFKNPFINELFLDENPSTPSEKEVAAPQITQEEAQQLSERIQMYHQEYEELRNDLVGIIEQQEVDPDLFREVPPLTLPPIEKRKNSDAASQMSIKQSFAALQRENSQTSNQLPLTKANSQASDKQLKLPPVQPRYSTGLVQKAETKQSFQRLESQKSDNDIILHIKSLNSEQIQVQQSGRQQSVGPKPAAMLSFLDQDIAAAKPRQSLVTLKLNSDQNKSNGGSVKRSESGRASQQVSFNPLNKNDISFKASIIEQPQAPVQFQTSQIQEESKAPSDHESAKALSGLGSAKNVTDTKLNFVFGNGEGTGLVPSTVKYVDTHSPLTKPNATFGGLAEVQIQARNSKQETPEQVREFMKRESLGSEVRMTINQTSLDATSYQLQVPGKQSRMINQMGEAGSPSRSMMQSVNFQSDMAPISSDKSTTYKEVWSQDSFTMSHRPPTFPLQPFTMPIREGEVPQVKAELTEDQLKQFNSIQQANNLLTLPGKADKKAMATRKLSIGTKNKAEALHSEATMARKQQTYVQRKGNDSTKIDKEDDNASHSNLSFGGAAVVLGLQGKVGSHLLKTMATYKSTFTLGAANR